MARPPLPLGTWGEIRTVKPPPSGPASWRAIAKYRGCDGKTVQVERRDGSEAKAIRRLRDELRTRAGSSTSSADLSPSSRFADAADLWIEDVRKRRVGTTYDRYRGRLDKHVLPAVGQLLLRECTVGRLRQFMSELEHSQDMAAATLRGIRTVLSGVMQEAVEHGVITHNPVRELKRIEDRGRRGKQTFTNEQLLDFLHKMDTDKQAARSDLPDLVCFLFGTGVRFGEALAVRWREVNLDDQATTVDGQLVPPQSVWVNGNIVAETGRGLVRHDGKSKRSNRIIGLPPYLFTLLLVRKPLDAHNDEPVFPSATLGWRHPSNVQRAIRRLRSRVDYPDFTTHVGRRTVATALDHAGQTARQIADQLGHANPSMTQNVYMGRGLANPEAATLLDRTHHRSA